MINMGLKQMKMTDTIPAGEDVYYYNFPAYDVDSNIDFAEQIAKIEEEITEIADANNADNLEQIAIEAMDVIVACETLLRMLPKGYPSAAYAMVYAKIRSRNKWVTSDAS